MAFVELVDTTRAARSEHADTPGWQRFIGGARRAHIDLAELIRCNVHRCVCDACFTRPVAARTARLFESAEAKDGQHDIITRTWLGQS